MNVIKRDGSEVPFDHKKIEIALNKAFVACGISQDDHDSLMDRIMDGIFGGDCFTVEAIQDIVETELMKEYPTVAKTYILYRQHHGQLRKSHPDPTAISDYIHASKYARYLPQEKRREVFAETVDRVALMHLRKFWDLKDDIISAFEKVHEKKVLPSMRSMQFAGDPILSHPARMYNCAFTHINRVTAFSESMYLLLCGCGVGFSVQKHHIAKLPRLSDQGNLSAFFQIPDNMEGWADAVKELVVSFVEGYNLEFDYSLIRPAGSPLKSGGKAPGHLSLKKSLEAIRKVLKQAQGRHLKSIECYDIICHISSAVLSGGIRRSSCLALFSKNDEEMLYAKHGTNFNYDGKNSQRALANNSVALLRQSTTRGEFIELMSIGQGGEPGFVFLDNLELGINPCGEIILDPITTNGRSGVAFCNLTEVNAARCKTKTEFLEACHAASLIGTLQASYTDFQYLSSESKEIAERDALIGVSITGIMDNEKVIQWMAEGREEVNATNRDVAKCIGINLAARTTCIKPSGTASLALGCVASGIHPHHSKRYFRRITANPNEVVAREFRKINPQMVEVKPDGNWCITFPVETEGVTLADITPSCHLYYIISVYEQWCDGHNISATLVMDNWGILERVYEGRRYISALTFLLRGSDKDIPYCPREEVVTEADMALWTSLCNSYNSIDWLKIVEDEDDTSHVYEAACDIDGCETTVVIEGNGEFYSLEERKVVSWQSGSR